MANDIAYPAETTANDSLYSEDLAPISTTARTWSTWNYAALWISMSLCIPTYMLASSLIGGGMSWWQAIATIFLGNTIVLIPMILNGRAGAKYGIPFPVYARASFGVKGANVPALLRAIVACGWFGIQTWIGGLAIVALVSAAAPSLATMPGLKAIGFLIFWGIEVAIILRGIEAIKVLSLIVAPVLMTGSIVLLTWAASHAGGLGYILAQSAQLQKGQANFWALFPAALTANV